MPGHNLLSIAHLLIHQITTVGEQLPQLGASSRQITTCGGTVFSAWSLFPTDNHSHWGTASSDIFRYLHVGEQLPQHWAPTWQITTWWGTASLAYYMWGTPSSVWSLYPADNHTCRGTSSSDICRYPHVGEQLPQHWAHIQQITTCQGTNSSA